MPTEGLNIMRYLILALVLLSIFSVCYADQQPGQKYVMHLSDNWEITGDLPLHAMFISLQGVANIGEPRLYFQYPAKWDYNFSDPLLEHYRSSRKMQFKERGSEEKAQTAHILYSL